MVLGQELRWCICMWNIPFPAAGTICPDIMKRYSRPKTQAREEQMNLGFFISFKQQSGLQVVWGDTPFGLKGLVKPSVALKTEECLMKK